MVLNRQRGIRFRQNDREELERFTGRLAREARINLESFSVVLVSDRRMRALNRRYRGQPASTDVLSFPAKNGAYRGDVVIAVETARRQARRLGHPWREELKFLVLHGVLHLLGYDHETDNGRMNRREHTLRRRLGLE